MATTPQKPATLVDKIVADFKSSWDYRENSWHTNWTNMGKLYNSERVFVGYDGISDTFVPMPYSTVETMVAGTAGDKPFVEYIPTKPEQNTNTEVLNSLFAYYWDIDGWTPKMVQHSRILYKLGTGILRGYWNIDHPCIDIIPLRDYFCDPNATFFTVESAKFMGHRFMSDLDTLKEEQVIDPKTGDLVAKYKNLDNLEVSGDTNETTAKQERDNDLGSPLTGKAAQNQIEIICYETKDKIYYVGNRKEIIYENDNYFKQRQQFLGFKNPTGMFSYIVDAYSPDEAQLYGKSVIDPIAKPTELLNDLTNQNVDAVSWALDPEMELDPQYSSYLGKIASATGNIYPFKPGSYQAVKKPLMPANVFNERTNIKNEIREVTAIDQIIKGIAMGGDTTATEVKAQVASAGRRFNLLVAMLESGGYYKMAKLVFQMIQLYVTQPTMFRVVGQQGVDWQKFDPKEFKGDYEPRVKLKATLDNEKQLKIRDVKEMYSAMVGNPFVDEYGLTKFVLRKAFNLALEEVDELVKKPEQVAQDAQGAGQSKGKPPTELINYKDAPPDVQAQMEAAAGFTPSATHEGSMGNAASGHIAQDMTNVATAHEALAGPMPQPNQGAPGGPTPTPAG